MSLYCHITMSKSGDNQPINYYHFTPTVQIQSEKRQGKHTV